MRTEKTKVHYGPIHSSVAGRTDHIPITLAAGSYVIPADIISAMGEGNTMAGFKSAKHLFGENQPREVTETVPIVAAGGEYVISPVDVVRIGKGTLDDGYKILDEFVVKYRKSTVDRLKKLPAPRRD